MPSFKEIRLKPIGFVRRLSKWEGVKDRSLVSHIIVRKDLAEALEGVEDFSHLLIVFYMHEVSNEETNIFKVHPRGRADLPLLGVFATRAASRPNPIGLTLVELLKRQDNVLIVKGLDALDGTPVLDVKPFDGKDVVLEARVPEWCKKLHS